MNIAITISSKQRIRKALKVAATLFSAATILIVIAFLLLFPGPQRSIAFTLATGIGTTELQERVDAIEAKAIEGVELSAKGCAFLKDLYICFAKGGKYSMAAPESSRMMFRYLSKTAEPLKTPPSLFAGSRPVKEAIGELR